MKIYKLYCLLPLILLFTSCNSDQEFFTLETPEDNMHLAISNDSIILNANEAAKEVALFTWGKATDRGPKATITYQFKIYSPNDNTKTTELKDLPEGSLSVGYKTSELNDLLVSWGILPGTLVTLEAELIAKVTASTFMMPECSTVKFKIVGY